jgi:TraU protein
MYLTHLPPWLSSWAALTLIIVSLARPGEAQEGIAALPNPNCAQFTILGPCSCGFPPTPTCLQVAYWEPGWLVETVKIPGDTAIAPIQQALGTFGPPLHVLGGGGAGNSPGSGQTNLHFNEAHVMTFPRFLGGPCTGCQAGQTQVFNVHYLSEIDPLWRLAVGAPSILDLFGLGQLGVWAPLYPRIGFAIHGSEPVGSGIAAARALDIAANPFGVPTNPENRVIITPTLGYSRCCQLASPVQTPCFNVGTNPALWETGTVSATGKYIWIFWRFQTCCVPPSEVWCGALLGDYGANLCITP